MNAGNKYSRLKDFLTAITKVESTLSLAELETVLGFPLPDSARAYPAWWANQTTPSGQSNAWTSAGWRAYPNLKTESVTFRKQICIPTALDRNPVSPILIIPAAEHQLQEDEVKEHLRAFLESGGWRTTIAPGKTHGIDIDAFKEDKRWIIEVKGCGSRNEMRVNYFLAALGELLQRMNNPRAKYSIAFPDLVQFRGLWERLGTVAKSRTGITCLFVRSHGEVDETS